jgi:hypothetical protein
VLATTMLTTAMLPATLLTALPGLLLLLAGLVLATAALLLTRFRIVLLLLVRILTRHHHLLQSSWRIPRTRRRQPEMMNEVALRNANNLVIARANSSSNCRQFDMTTSLAPCAHVQTRL